MFVVSADEAGKVASRGFDTEVLSIHNNPRSRVITAKVAELKSSVQNVYTRGGNYGPCRCTNLQCFSSDYRRS